MLLRVLTCHIKCVAYSVSYSADILFSGNGLNIVFLDIKSEEAVEVVHTITFLMSFCSILYWHLVH